MDGYIKKNVRLLVSVVTFVALTATPWLNAMQVEPVDLQASLKILAETKGFGYKTANLYLLQERLLGDKQLQASLQKIGHTVAIPDFVGISSDDSKKILARMHVNIETRHKTLSSELPERISV